MKITKKQLNQIIKEEINRTIFENETGGGEVSPEHVEMGQQMQDTPVGKIVFDALDRDPKVQAALKKALGAVQEGKDGEGGDGKGQYQAMGAIGGLGAAQNQIAQTMYSGLDTGGLGDIALEVGPAAMGILQAAGMGVGAAAMGALVGYLIYKGVGKALGK